MLAEIFDQFVKRDAPGDGNRFGGRSHGTGNESGLLRRGVGVGEFPRNLCSGVGDGVRLLVQLVFAQHEGRGAERVRLEDVGAYFQVRLVNLSNDSGVDQIKVLIATLELVAAEVVRSESVRLNSGTHGTVGDKDPLFEGFFEQVRTTHA